MARTLTEIERVYVKVKVEEGGSADTIAGNIEGIGPVTVQSYMDELEIQRQEKESEDKNVIETVEDMEVQDGESKMDRDLRIASSRTRVEDLMARRVNEIDGVGGVVAMTEAASTLADERKRLDAQPTEGMKKRQKEHIHKPFDGINHGGPKNRTTGLIRE